MKVRSVHFEAFKSLYDLTAILDNLTVITGANGSGKSNLVDGLVFISNAYMHGLEFAVSHGGGYENIAHRRTRRVRRPVRVAVEVLLSADEVRDHARFGYRRGTDSKKPRIVPLIIRHEFSFRAMSQKLTADFEVVEERLTIANEESIELASISRSRGKLAVSRTGAIEGTSALLDELLAFYESEDDIERFQVAPSELFIVRRYFPDAFWSVARYLSAIRVFQLSPHTSRLPGVASPRAQLERHGENLPGAADFLRRNQADAWSRVESAMRSIIPTLEGVTIAYTEDRRLAVQFREKGVGRPWNASEVSDGTIQTFALLVAIFDERSSILVIEELENALHPWILRQLIGLCDESPRQILLTTHSPVLLNYVAPSAVQLMWMHDGRSDLSPLAMFDRDVYRQIMEGGMSLFEVYDSGLIPEGIPRGFGEGLT